MTTWQRQLANELASLAGPKTLDVCREDVYQLVQAVTNLLFPNRCDQPRQTADDWTKALNHVINLLERCLKETMQPHAQRADVIQQICAKLPQLKRQLDLDAAYFAEQDPACHSVDEVVLCYPGFFALMVHRVAHAIHQLAVPLLPRMVSEYAHEKTGIDIHPGARIDCPIFIDHGTGIVIGETTQIGSYVKMFQGVTLGAPVVLPGMKGHKRHPTIGHHVVLYANATILGGDTVIGDHAVIGGNAWVLRSVPPHTRVYHQPAVPVYDDPEGTAP
jgi:serine O-acetyltransferase